MYTYIVHVHVHIPVGVAVSGGDGVRVWQGGLGEDGGNIVGGVFDEQRQEMLSMFDSLRRPSE